MEERILIVDDEEDLTLGYSKCLSKAGYEVRTANSGEDAVDLLKEELFDLVFLDIRLPKMDGIEATRRIILAQPNMKILILSSFGDDNNVLPAIQAGALGYVLKDIDPEELVEALLLTAQGKSQLDPNVANILISHMQEGTGEGKSANQKVNLLTSRELEVLIQIGKGLSNKEIASTLSISPMTVKTHVSNILGKLQLSDRTQAAIYSIRQGLVTEE